MKPHKDLIRKGKRSAGYSIRMGKKLPENSANLAYMYSKPLNPKENLFIEDRSSLIQENGLQQYVEKEVMVFPDKDYLLESEQGQSEFPSDKIYLTDEFTVKRHPQDVIHPLYYRMECKGRFDARGSYVLPYQGGRTTKFVGDSVYFEDLNTDIQSDLLYMGDLIHIEEATTGILPDGCEYKIHLIRDNEPHLYRIVVYSNFRGEEGRSYKITYPAFSNGKSKAVEEVVNAYPFFEKVTYEELEEVMKHPTAEALSKKQYAIVPSGKGYKLYATSQVMIANMDTRPPQTFRYRTEAKLQTRMNETNKGTVNIGIAFLNKSVFGAENLSSIGKLLVNSALKPSYLTINNPHPPTVGLLKEDIQYWLVDLDMPAHHYYDYDIIVLTGYGENDLTSYRDYMNEYLKQGGVVWVDNAGQVIQDEEGDVVRNETLSFVVDGMNTFLTNIEFSNTEFESGMKRVVTGGGHQDRLYILPENVTELGYENVQGKVKFGSSERIENWDTWVQFGSGGPAVMTRTIQNNKGRLIVSNCGIFRSVYHNDDFSLKFLFNTILTYAESKWFNTPWKYDYVYHRDNLFEQEYKDIAGNPVYVDDRSDLDETQIVAKKVLGKNCHDMLMPHLPTWFQNATGTYYPTVEDDNEIVIPNQDFEGIAVDAGGNAKTSWMATTTNAIPGWNTNLFSGQSTTFYHSQSVSQRGARSVGFKITDTNIGARSFWESEEVFLPADRYELSSWIKTKDVHGIQTDGAKASVYSSFGTPIASTFGITETRNWIQVKTTFVLQSSQKVRLRLGFVDGNGSGEAYFDYVQVINKGNVNITPFNDGSKDLYAYAVAPKGENLSIDSEGFSEEDITRIQPEIPYQLMIKSFVYKWMNYTQRYERDPGNSVTYNYTVSKADGQKTYGFLHSLLPALKAGAEWEDKNRVYYEITAIGENGYKNPLVNLSLYDTNTGDEYFLKNGELVIGYKDLYWGRTTPTILLQAQTSYETIRLSKRHFGLKLTSKSSIYAQSPRTIDSRESWFLRIHNGSFVKNELGYEEWIGLSGNQAQFSTYENRTFLDHTYLIPEYDDQVFYPYEGVKTVENQVEFLTPKSIRLPHENLFVEIGNVEKEKMVQIGENRKVFEASRERWDERKDVVIYADRDGTGTLIEVFEKFDIDYKKGLITFEEDIRGEVQVSYHYQNLRVFKRTYGNGKISNELLKTDDRKTFRTSHPYLLYQPTIVLKKKVRENGKLVDAIISSKQYSVNYERGLIVFTDEQHEGIYIDYSYYTQQELAIEDYDIGNGIVYLKSGINFQDDVYAQYSYEENFYEYRGYFNAEIGQFLYLDLNPSVGHYSTLPTAQIVNGNQSVVYKYLPSSQLLNKEIHVYIVPSDVGGPSIRHCFSAFEWKKIQETNPLCLLLSKIYVREHTNVTQTVVMDSRKRGGGLSERISDQEIIKRVQHKQRYWDIGSWNGKAYYRNGTLIVSLPKRILQSQGGNFTEEQVEHMLDKYVAFGTYTIVEYV